MLISTSYSTGESREKPHGTGVASRLKKVTMAWKLHILTVRVTMSTLGYINMYIALQYAPRLGTKSLYMHHVSTPHTPRPNPNL